MSSGITTFTQTRCNVRGCSEAARYCVFDDQHVHTHLCRKCLLRDFGPFSTLWPELMYEPVSRCKGRYQSQAGPIALPEAVTEELVPDGESSFGV